MADKSYSYDELHSIITEAANKHGLDPNHMLAMAWQESGFKVNAVSNVGAVGLFQFIPETAKHFGLTDRTDPVASADAACRYMKYLIKKFGDLDIATASYNCGEGAMEKFQKKAQAQGLNPNDINDVSKFMTGGFKETKNYTISINKHKERAGWERGKGRISVGGSGSTGGEVSADTGESSPDLVRAFITEGAATNYDAGLFTNTDPLSQKKFDNLNRPLTISEGLDNPPWWSRVSSHLGAQHPVNVVANPNLAGSLAVWFRVMTLPGQFLADKDGNPIDLRLNCSLTSVDLSMKHKINRTPTRTGMHLTFWGMDPDTITASGKTGTWMNQWGITAGMSMLQKSAPKNVIALAESEGSYGDILGKGEPFQIAAQDAFIEFLGLFKNNGIIRYTTEDYETMDRRDQIDTALWSTQYGSNTYAANARNNDVMRRGSILMMFKGEYYQGYFKTFTFSEDANHPYVWDFDFSFQVQSKSQYSSVALP